MRAVQFHPFYCEEAKGSPCEQWDSSHGLSVIDNAGKRHIIGTIQHAEWASEIGRMIEKHGLTGIDGKQAPEAGETLKAMGRECTE